MMRDAATRVKAVEGRAQKRLCPRCEARDKEAVPTVDELVEKVEQFRKERDLYADVEELRDSANWHEAEAARLRAVADERRF
jgi:hypothetical protein